SKRQKISESSAFKRPLRFSARRATVVLYDSAHGMKMILDLFVAVCSNKRETHNVVFREFAPNVRVHSEKGCATRDEIINQSDFRTDDRQLFRNDRGAVVMINRIGPTSGGGCRRFLNSGLALK